MSDVKKKLLADIDRKAQRIKEKRVEAASNKNIESYVFQFFKDIEVYANQQDKIGGFDTCAQFGVRPNRKLARIIGMITREQHRTAR